jgi:hypothetical protein
VVFKHIFFLKKLLGFFSIYLLYCFYPVNPVGQLKRLASKERIKNYENENRNCVGGDGFALGL